MSVYYSVLIPAHNEEENLSPLLQEIQQVLSTLGKSWEVIVVDDASTDGTWSVLEKESAAMPQLKGILLARRSGQTAALDTGLHAASGKIFITMDGDGQNDPSDIPNLLKALDGVDCVSGCRERRQDTWQKKLVSRWANGLRRFLLGDGIHDTGCSLKAFHSYCFRNIKLYKGMHRFLPSLMIIEGFRVKELPVSSRPRKCGKSHYSLRNRGFSTLSDLLAVWWMKRRHVHAPVARHLPNKEST